jgi:hypothetical protein
MLDGYRFTFGICLHYKENSRKYTQNLILARLETVRKDSAVPRDAMSASDNAVTHPVPFNKSPLTSAFHH